MATFLLFVYGTLKRGGARHHALADQRFLGEARTRPLYSLRHLGEYPGLLPSFRGLVVHGELYEVDEARREMLDDLEGAPHLFDLGSVELEGIEGTAWAYYYRGRGVGPRIDSGRWENPV